MLPTKKGVSLTIEMWNKMLDMKDEINAEIDAKSSPKQEAYDPSKNPNNNVGPPMIDGIPAHH